MRQFTIGLICAASFSTVTAFTANTAVCRDHTRVRQANTCLNLELTRRETFGSLLASTLLPVASAFPEQSNAADDYPFKVSDKGVKNLGARNTESLIHCHPNWLRLTLGMLEKDCKSFP
jgi:hypothetical protein